MAIEIERKFLVKGTTYKTQAYDHYEILQGYIAHENGRSVRVRITDKEAILTIKGPSDSKGMSRYEWNHLISVDEARELFELVMAEVELNSENETFIKPDFIGKEVTGDHRYYNAYLATSPYKTWNKD